MRLIYICILLLTSIHLKAEGLDSLYNLYLDAELSYLSLQPIDKYTGNDFLEGINVDPVKVKLVDTNKLSLNTLNNAYKYHVLNTLKGNPKDSKMELIEKKYSFVRFPAKYDKSDSIYLKNYNFTKWKMFESMLPTQVWMVSEHAVKAYSYILHPNCRIVIVYNTPVPASKHNIPICHFQQYPYYSLNEDSEIFVLGKMNINMDHKTLNIGETTIECLKVLPSIYSGLSYDYYKKFIGDHHPVYSNATYSIYIIP